MTEYRIEHDSLGEVTEVAAAITSASDTRLKILLGKDAKRLTDDVKRIKKDAKALGDKVYRLHDIYIRGSLPPGSISAVGGSGPTSIGSP